MQLSAWIFNIHEFLCQVPTVDHDLTGFSKQINVHFTAIQLHPKSSCIMTMCIPGSQLDIPTTVPAYRFT